MILEGYEKKDSDLFFWDESVLELSPRLFCESVAPIWVYHEYTH